MVCQCDPDATGPADREIVMDPQASSSESISPVSRCPNSSMQSPERNCRTSPSSGPQQMKNIAEEKTSGEPIEMTVVQLLPDFDGSLEDLIFDEPISYTDEELLHLQTEVKFEESSENSLLHEERSLASAGFIPPAVLQKIVDSSDSVESLNPDTAKKVFHPVLLNRPSASLSVTNEGFIQLNDYKISFDSMGGGRLSEVRIAFNEKDNNQYAIKILSKKKLQNYNLLLRTSRNPLEEAYREISILKRLDHQNIITLVEVIDEPNDDNIYIVFELLDQALMDIPTECPFTEPEAKKYFMEILRGVDYLHQNRIVHRDLKPDNMLLSKDGVVKISDFGFCEELSMDSEANKDDLEIDSPCMQEVSAVHGTPAFTPPECLRRKNKPVSGYALDMWSLGISLYALVVGDVPFKADSMPLLFECIHNDPVRFPDLPISEFLKDLIRRLLDKDPKTRITMEQVKQHVWLTELESSSDLLISDTDDVQEEKKGADHISSSFEKDLIPRRESELKQA